MDDNPSADGKVSLWVDNYEAQNRWLDTCVSFSGDEDAPDWYAPDTPGIYNDYAACLKDAQAGNERAQQYIARYTQLRMTTK